MLFNSYEFIFAFLPLTFFGYFWLVRRRQVVAGKALLVFASLVFYGWWNAAYVPLILASMLFNFMLGRRLGRADGNRRALLVFGVGSNLALLGYFKYADFLITNINAVGGSLPLLHLALPLAISFFTFQQIAYLVDSYEDGAREYDFLNYGLFVTFFPHLIAGPITHHAEMMPQFAHARSLVLHHGNIARGLFIFSLGLFKKVVIADSLAVYASSGFDGGQTLNLLEGWATSLSYTLQLYFDFSGYSDMAVGGALLFNIRLPNNFNSPYRALSVQDFWRRWHMTLSRFLRDYVYIRLGGNRRGTARTYLNLFVTFLLGGLWHGAGWTFIVWGALHGGALVVHRLWEGLGLRLHAGLAWFLCFNFINIAWVFFRARDFDSAWRVLSAMFFGDLVLPPDWQAAWPVLARISEAGPWLHHIYADGGLLAGLIVLLVVAIRAPNSQQWMERLRFSPRSALVSAGLFVGAVTNLSHVTEFLYFNF